MLRAHEHGIVLIDSMQLAGLVLGCEFGARTLANVAEQILGVELPKEQQLSDWGAEVLSTPAGQLRRGRCRRVPPRGAAMWRQLSREERRCFEVQNAAIPAIARMRLTGCPFDPAIHRETIRRWEARARREARRIQGSSPARSRQPATRPARWLEAHLPAEEISWMPRTDNGTVSARSDLLKHLAHHAEIRPLLRVLWSDKRLRSFGHKLIEAVSPVTGRVHPDFMLGTKAGRLACTAPNFQQLPPDVRVAIVAPPGRLLVVADYQPARAARARRALRRRAIFAPSSSSGGDVHRAAAAAIAGIPIEEVTDDQRKAAKAIVFGTNYGSGAKGLRASAWANFEVDLTLDQAAAAREAYLNRYPGIREYQRRQADLAQAAGVVRSVLGRPLKAEWEGGRLKYTQAVNFPIQASASDVMLVAMAKVEQALPGAMVLQVHDELVLEVPEDQAEDTAGALAECMAMAFAELFPGAPRAELVKVKIVRVWSDAK